MKQICEVVKDQATCAGLTGAPQTAKVMAPVHGGCLAKMEKTFGVRLRARGMGHTRTWCCLWFQTPTMGQERSPCR
jgi:hypothetical protein